MFFTRTQTENISRIELVEKLSKLLYVSSKNSGLKKFNDYVSKYRLYSELQVSKSCNSPLLQRIIQL